jgi:hypothetical protein
VEQFLGRVERRLIASGSKSERRAVTLVTRDGVYVLRRLGGNAFSDPMLDELVGKKVAFHGTARGTTLVVSDWKLL